MSERPSYSVEAVQAILPEALSQQAEERFPQAHLLEMAAEMNIDPEVLEQTEQD